MGLYGGSHIAGQMEANQPIFPYSTMGNVQTSTGNNFSTLDLDDFKFSTEA